MPQQRFGGEHTELKLSKVEDYLKAYTEALKNQDFRLIYFDAFAGTGDIPQARNGAPRLPNVDDYEPFIVGSALRALSLPIPFDEYVFVDSDEKKVAKLETLANEFPHLRERMHLKCADANLELQRFCADRDWRKWRAVIFLDPFGNQVEWKTIESIA
ncbi:MAG: three-Cys-motif partner protein TcmP [Hyphomicrobiales bacterium]|nr:three-Cys-motif partner protein TcmP [Hyphomicrobiales bacterium]